VVKKTTHYQVRELPLPLKNSRGLVEHLWFDSGKGVVHHGEEAIVDFHEDRWLVVDIF
jgi:hypothetical protein